MLYTKQISISIALCTYNGAKYILEQLDSIAAQEYLPTELVICDDASSDNTVLIIKEFAMRAPFPIKVFCNETSLGVSKNFEKAVSLCKGEYIALCDQDDIWLPNKIKDSINTIITEEECLGSEIPILVHSDLQVVDKQCNVIHSSFMHMRQIHHEEKEQLKVLLTHNFVTGCTVMMNRCLINKALPFPPKVLMHDWWFAIVAAATGKILLSQESNILYRQHGNNQVGACGFYAIYNMKKIFKLSYLDKLFAGAFLQAIDLKNHLAKLSYSKSTFLDDYIKIILQGGISAVLRIHKMGISQLSYIRRIIFYLILIRCKYKDYI
ncbi:Glycosyltransferases involved in cell wall biogenesis [Sporomusa sp. KB1]|nr:Glycosyltransferases involved in cell wall biogenesis [Sporomusa sp. KB1]